MKHRLSDHSRRWVRAENDRRVCASCAGYLSPGDDVFGKESIIQCKGKQESSEKVSENSARTAPTEPLQ